MLDMQLQLSKYRFTLEALDDISLPGYKGSTFHGGFGRALMQISPTWYRYFYHPGGQQGDWPKPFVLLPPLDTLESYPKGHQFHLELTLFGEATRHYAIAQAAVEYLGARMGLGYELGKYKIIDITQTQPEITQIQKQTKQIKIHLPTRLRIKANNRLQKQAPDFALLINRLTGRLKTLEKAYADTQGDFHELLRLAKTIKLANTNTQWDDWERFSGSQRKWMKFGGLMGSISYTGDLQPFMEVLKLGEWLHIGNKTSFGLGKYELNYQGENT